MDYTRNENEHEAALALDCELRRSRAASGAVVSAAGGRLLIDAARPDAAWLRSVDLYIAGELLADLWTTDAPAVAASDRRYRRVEIASAPAVIILAGP